MKLEKRTIKHPSIKNRDITVIFIDDRLDEHSLGFLAEEARTGGRQGTIAGQETHRTRAYKIKELYRALHDYGLTWDKAKEEDIKKIRNSMLCWDMNEAPAEPGYYDYEPIRNDTMNEKLSVWFKFFKYQARMKKPMKMVMSTTLVNIALPDHLLNHAMGFEQGQRKKQVERWDIKVRKSPSKMYYPAINKSEFEAFRSQLRIIDIVYEMMAVFMVETGLRIDAVMKVDHMEFQNWLRHLSFGGKMENDCIPIRYQNKGGAKEKCDLPIRTIRAIQTDYRACEYSKRLIKYEKEWEGMDEPMWLREDGKEVQQWDVRMAFRQASIAMGRTINKITPHHMRHTFATWIVVDTCKKNNIPIGVIGLEPHPLLLATLMGKMGHVSSVSTLRYTLTAFRMTNSGSSGPIINASTINKSKVIRRIIAEKAQEEFGDEIEIESLDYIAYGKQLGFAVEYI